MDISLDRGKNKPALGHGSGVCFCELLSDNLKAHLRGVGALDKLRQEQPALLESLADLVERGDELGVYYVHSVVLFELSAGDISRLALEPVDHGFGQRGVGALNLRLFGGSVGVVCLYEGARILIDTRQHLEGSYSAHHIRVVGVDDREVEPLLKRHSEEYMIYKRSVRQTEADVGNSETGPAAELGFYPVKRAERFAAARLLRGDREREAVDIHVAAVDSASLGSLDDFSRDFKTSLRCLGDPVLVKGKTDDGSAVLLYERKNGAERFFLAVDGVYYRLAVVYPQRRLEHVGLRGVYLERHVDDGLQRLYHAHHHFLFVDFGQSDVDVENVRARLYLADCLGEDIIYIVIDKRLLK